MRISIHLLSLLSCALFCAPLMAATQIVVDDGHTADYKKHHIWARELKKLMAR